MPEKGDIFDLGTNEYVEFLENFDDLHDLVGHYTRDPENALKEVRILTLVPVNSLDGEYRKIGPNERERLMHVYRNAYQKKSPEFERLTGTEK